MGFFLHPWGLLALLCVPLVILLHVLRRRFEPKVVSAVFLWNLQNRSPVSGRQWERLQRSPSFWLEVLAALLLCLLFAGLRLPWTREAEHLVAVLDGSASMSAIAADGSVRDAALAALRARIDDLAPRSRVTVVVSGATPRVLVGPAAFAGEASTALAGFAPAAPRHDPLAALALASQFAGTGSVLFITDQFHPDEAPDEIEVLSVGRSVGNVALTHAVRVADEQQESIFLTITSFADEATDTVLELRTAGEPLARNELLLGPRERRHLTFPVPRDAPPINVLLSDDALAIDNTATLMPPRRRTVRLGTTLDESLALYLGLTSAPGANSRVDRWQRATRDTVAAASPDAAHLLIGSEIGGSDQTWCLVLQGNPERDPRDLIGPFLADRHHPLLDGCTLEGVIWSIDESIQLPGLPLVSAGNLPILTERLSDPATDRRVFAMNFHPRRSSLQRSPDWPILLANLVELRRAALPGPGSTNVLMGERFVYHGFGAGKAIVTSGEHRAEVAVQSTLTLLDLPRPGVYEVADGEGEPVCRFAVNFQDAAESDLTLGVPGRRPSARSLATTTAGFGWLEILLLTLLLAVVLLDWLVLRRGLRVTPAAT